MITQEIIDFANNLADLSAEIVHKYFRTPDNGEITKSDDSPVTKADRQIEEMIREKIMKHFPDHGIIGEEYGNVNINADYVWIIDPIDGTSSFISGRPIFGTLIALSYKGKPVFGMMNQPITNERWIGISGQLATLNGKKISSRKSCKEIQDAIFCTCSPFFFQDEDKNILEKVAKRTKYQNFGGIIYGGDCYMYSCLAMGFIDLIIDPGLKVYDYAALVPIIEMSGGIITDWEGKDLNLQSGVKILAAGNNELHKKAIELIHQ